GRRRKITCGKQPRSTRETSRSSKHSDNFSRCCVVLTKRALLTTVPWKFRLTRRMFLPEKLTSCNEKDDSTKEAVSWPKYQRRPFGSGRASRFIESPCWNHRRRTPPRSPLGTTAQRSALSGFAGQISRE